jgi:thioredoxin-like negative regulator of GroEL
MEYIYFGASWCSPCKTLTPEVSASPKNIQILDVDTNKVLADKFGISSVPMIIGVTGGGVFERYLGAPSIRKFLKT